ncbi:MAG: hypothetical protein GY719_17930 [bacterium]|nr:hypothetical protein [bacterium]
MSIVVINAPSGSGLTSAVRKIEEHLQAEPHNLSTCVVDLEDKLIETVLARFPELSFPNESPMQSVLWRLPRDVIVRRFWPQAAVAALRELNASKADIRFLSCHLSYYRAATYELFEPGDLVSIYRKIFPREARAPRDRIAVVLTLIDEVYEMFSRLSGDHQVFPMTQHIRDEYTRRADAKQPTPSESDAEGQYLLAIEQVVATLIRLLAWRDREFSAADALATRAGARHYLIGIKHPVRTAGDLVAFATGINSSLLPVYLSHPISRPRKQQKGTATHAWGDFVRQFHNFVSALNESEVDGKRIVPLMPTAIDEYRLSNIEEDIFPCLHRRWPLLSPTSEDLLFDLPSKYPTYDSYERAEITERLLNPAGSSYNPVDESVGHFASSALEVGQQLSEKTKETLGGLFGSLIQQIRLQLATRDHALVRHTGSLLLYRPFYDEPRLSGGVKAELDHWLTLARYGLQLEQAGEPVPWPYGPAVFLHATADITNPILLERLQPMLRANLLPALTSALGENEARQLNLEGADLLSEAWLDHISNSLRDPLLGGGEDPREGRRRREVVREIWLKERALTQHQAYTAVPNPSEVNWARFILVDDLPELTFAAIRQRIVKDVIPRFLEHLEEDAE